MRKPFPRPVTRRRRSSQAGQEIMEFALVGLMFVPLFLGMFIASMNLIRAIQVTHVCRDIGNMFIHGGDFSDYGLQSQAARLANGLGLDVGSTFTGNRNANNSGAGRGVVIISQITFIGAPSCAAVAPAACTNSNQYVFTQRIVFGNTSLRASNFGTPTAVINSNGIVQNYTTDSRAVAPGFASNLQTQMVDGQVIYIAEVYFDSPDLAVSAITPGGIYSRVFF